MSDAPDCKDSKTLFAFLALTVLAGASCGVKAPPLPPQAATPQQSDLRAMPRPTPTPLATMAPSS